jgi:hypothetical protein
MPAATRKATDHQIAYLTALINRDFWAAQSRLQTAYEARNGKDGWEVTKSGYAKHVLRHLTTDEASSLIDELA